MTLWLLNTREGIWQVHESAENDFLDEFFEAARSQAESEHGADEPEAQSGVSDPRKGAESEDGGDESKGRPGQPSPKQGLSEFFKRFDDEQLEALAAACEKLANAQREGTRQFYKRSDDGGRAPAIMQLEAAIFFIEAFNCGDGTDTLPLQQLLWALKDLDAGAVAPIVKPRALSNRPPDISARKAARMYTVVTMQLLMDFGSDKKHAAEAAAKILGQAGITIKRTRSDDSIIDWKTVAKWRDQIQAEIKQEPDSPFALTYSRLLKEGREHLRQLRRDGFDLDGNQVDNREIRNRALGSLALFLAQHGESFDPKVMD
jgi:hypothetical protein